MMAEKKKVSGFSRKLARCVEPVNGTCVAATLIRTHLEYEKLLNTKFHVLKIQNSVRIHKQCTSLLLRKHQIPCYYNYKQQNKIFEMRNHHGKEGNNIQSEELN